MPQPEPSPIITNRGIVRMSADGWGVGLYSPDGQYRYWFVTEVDRARRPGDPAGLHDDGLPRIPEDTLVWVGLNPSRSDDQKANRATLRTVLFWAEREGFARVLGANLFSYRHTDPETIERGVVDPAQLQHMVGPYTDEILQAASESSAPALLAWGGKGKFAGREAAVAGLFRDAYCVGLRKSGEPLHPARKSWSLQFQPYRR
jgi:hypothetical protein